MTIVTPSRTRPVSAARLCALNGGIQLVWGAILGVSLQARSIELAANTGVATYGRIAAAGALVATIVQIVSGLASDRVRRRAAGGAGRGRGAFYFAGVCLAVPALAWFYLAATVVQLAAAFALLQIAMNIVTGPYQAIIPDYVAPKQRGRASSWMAAYQSIGNAAGLLVAGLIGDPRLVAAVIAGGLALSYAVTATYQQNLSEQPSTAIEGASVFRLPGSLRVLLVSRGLINVGFFTLLGFLLFFVRSSLNVTGAAVKTQTALLFLTFTLAAVAGAAIAAGPTDRHDKRLVVSLAVVAIVAALAVLATSSALPPAYGSAAVAGAAWGAFVTADWALAAALLPSGEMATAMGVWNIATTIPQVIAPLVTAPLVSRLDLIRPGLGPRTALGLAAIEFAAGAVAVWRLPRA